MSSLANLDPNPPIVTSDPKPKASACPAPPPDGARLWRVQHVAWVLQCSVRQVNYLTQSGQLPSIKLGDSRRYLPTAVEAWIAAQPAAVE